MISRELANEAAALLGTAVGMMVEDDHAVAVQQPADPADWQVRAERLLQLGSDVATLASAIAVLTRRSADRPDTTTEHPP